MDSDDDILAGMDQFECKVKAQTIAIDAIRKVVDRYYSKPDFFGSKRGLYYYVVNYCCGDIEFIISRLNVSVDEKREAKKFLLLLNQNKFKYEDVYGHG